MTWMTPFDVVDVGRDDSCAPDEDIAAADADRSDWPLSVVTEWRFTTLAAVSLPLATW